MHRRYTRPFDIRWLPFVLRILLTSGVPASSAVVTLLAFPLFWGSDAFLVRLFCRKDQKWHSKEYQLQKTDDSVWRLPDDCTVKVKVRLLWSKCARLADKIKWLEAQQAEGFMHIAGIHIVLSSFISSFLPSVLPSFSPSFLHLVLPSFM
jgi:hypothetical protein